MKRMLLYILIGCICFYFFSACLVPAYAAAALVPAAGAAVVALLGALGLIVLSPDTQTFTVPYNSSISSIIGEPTVGSDYAYNQLVDILPDNYYYTDDGGTTICDPTGTVITSPSQLVFKGSSLANTSNNARLPLNYIGSLKSDSPLVPSKYFGSGSFLPYLSISGLDNNKTVVPCPIFSVAEGTPLIVGVPSIAFFKSTAGIVYQRSYGDVFKLLPRQYAGIWFKPPVVLSYYNYSGGYDTSGTLDDMSNVGDRVYTNLTPAEYNLISSRCTRVDWLICDGFPRVNSLTSTGTVDLTKVDDTYISPPEPPDDDDDTPYVVPGVSLWDIADSIDDILDIIGGTNTNPTTVSDYIDNDYTFNQNVSIDVPSDYDVNLHGGLTVNTPTDYDININVNDDVPSVGDVSGDVWYNTGIGSVVGAVSDNPFIGLLSGLFDIIDPKLIIITSSAISLTVIVSLWRLIRGH